MAGLPIKRRAAGLPALALIRRGLLAAALCLCSVAAQAEVARLLALSPHLAELACAAGACDRLVGRVAYSDWPPELRALPEIGDAWTLDAEAVIALRPDRVLAWQGGTPERLIEQLERAGVAVDRIAIDRLDGIAAALRQIGERAGTASVAEQAAETFTRRLRALRERYAGLEPVRVLYQIEREPMFSISRRSPIHDAIEVCGGRNVFADLPGVAAPVSAEAAVARQPQVIVFARQDGEAAIRAWWQRFGAVPAVRGGHLYGIDADLLSRPTPRMLDGVAELCERIDRVRRATASSS